MRKTLIIRLQSGIIQSQTLFFKIHWVIHIKKILFQVYINQILEYSVKSWLFKKQDYVWRENNNRKYGKVKNCNIIY